MAEGIVISLLLGYFVYYMVSHRTWHSAQSAFDKRRWDEALRHLAWWQRLHPFRPEAMFMRGCIYFYEERYQDSIVAFTNAIKRHQNYADAYVWRGMAYGKLGQEALARTDHAMVDYLKKLNYLIQADVAESLTAAGNTTDALAIYDKEIADNQQRFSQAVQSSPYIDPHTVQYISETLATWYGRRAQLLTGIGRFEDALSDLSKATEHSPIRLTFYVSVERARVLERMGNLTAALQELSTARAVDPQSYEVYVRRAQVRYGLKDYDGGIDECFHAISLRPHVSDAYYWRAYCYFEKEAYLESIADINEVIRQMPDSANALNLRGASYFRLGEYKRAADDFAAADALDPDDEYILTNLGKTWMILGDLERAHQHMIKAYALHPQSKHAISCLALTHHTLDNVPEAQRLWRELTAKDERYGDADWAIEDLRYPTLLAAATRVLIASLEATKAELSGQDGN